VAAVRALRAALYFAVGILIAAVWCGAALAVDRIPAIVLFPSGTYAAQCAQHVAAAIAAHNCPGDAVAGTVVDYPGNYPHKICRMTCEGQPYGDALAMATMGCQDPAVTAYEADGGWWCAFDAATGCAALASIELPDAVAAGGATESSLISGTGTTPSVCRNGCAQRGSAQGWSAAQNTWWAVGPYRFTGEPCAAGLPESEPDTEDKLSPEAQCAKTGQGWGTINGTVICFGQETTETTQTKTSQEGEGKTSVETTKVCTGDQCTVTTKTTHTGGGASGTETNGTTTRTSTGDRVSQGTGDGDGAGGADEDKNACRDNPYAPDCLGAPAVQGEVEEQQAGSEGITAVVVGDGTGFCPAAVTIWHGITVPFDAACDLAGMLRPLVIAFAWLAAGVYVVGGLRNG